jgi:hypothetical protein
MSKKSYRNFQLSLDLVLASLMIAGCVTYSEKYFIEVQECRPGWDLPHSSFLKLDLLGQTLFTTSKFEMGWYDRRGVDSLFSTMSPTSPNTASANQPQPNTVSGGEDLGLDCNATSNDKRVWRHTRVYGPNGRVMGDEEGKRLVIFAASNPSDLINRISTATSTLAVSEQFAGYIRQPEMNEVARAEMKMDHAGRRHEALAIEVQELLALLETGGPTNEVLKAKLLILSGHASATVERR